MSAFHHCTVTPTLLLFQVLGMVRTLKLPEEPKALSSLEAWLVTACYG